VLTSTPWGPIAVVGFIIFLIMRWRNRETKEQKERREQILARETAKMGSGSP